MVHQCSKSDDNPEAVFVRLQSGRVTIPVGARIFLQHLSVTCLQERQTSAVLLFYADDTVNMGRTDYFTGRLAIFYMLIRT